MCGIFCALSAKQRILPSDELFRRLHSRGPDSTDIKHAHYASSTGDAASGSPEVHVTLCSTVLSLRGSKVVDQPFQDPEGRYTLCWNGEAWRVNDLPATGNDTAAVHQLLVTALEGLKGDAADSGPTEGIEQIRNALSNVSGPYAFVFYDHVRGKLYFGRDFLGRRSLCWRIEEDGSLIICSVTDGVQSLNWQEVEADGVHVVDLPLDSSRPGSSPPDGHEERYHRMVTTFSYLFRGEGSSVCSTKQPHMSYQAHTQVGTSPSFAQQNASPRFTFTQCRFAFCHMSTPTATRFTLISHTRDPQPTRSS